MRALILAALLAAPAAAQEGFIGLFGETFLFLLPDWTEGLSGEEVIAASKVHEDGTETRYIIEFIPAAESFDAWTNLQAILARRDGADVATDLDEMEATFRAGCAPETLVVIRSDRMDTLPEVENGAFGTVFCGAYAEDPSRGEIAVLRVVEKDGVVARLYREWRGAAFDPRAGAALPVPVTEVARTNDAMLRSDFAR